MPGLKPLFFAALLPLLSGCTAIAVGGALVSTKMILDSRSIDSQLDDSVMHFHVVQGLQEEPQLAEERIRVIAYGGDILLIGQVAGEHLKQMAERIAQRSGKPVHLYNEITVGEKRSFIDASKDSLITTRLKTRLLSNSEYDTSGIKVITEHGVVFLLGIIEQNAADYAVETARRMNGVEKVVRAFSIKAPTNEANK